MAHIARDMESGVATVTAPIYLLLFPIPIVCFVGALLTDIAYSASAFLMWLHFSEWLIAAGLAFNRYGQTWLRRQFVTRHSDVTSALVGVAGAFVGFHIGVILGLLPSPLMHYIIAAIGALAMLWLWRGR